MIASNEHAINSVAAAHMNPSRKSYRFERKMMKYRIEYEVGSNSGVIDMESGNNRNTLPFFQECLVAVAAEEMIEWGESIAIINAIPIVEKEKSEPATLQRMITHVRITCQKKGMEITVPIASIVMFHELGDPPWRIMVAGREYFLSQQHWNKLNALLLGEEDE